MKNTNKTKKTFNKKIYLLLAGMFATSVSATSIDPIEVMVIETTNHSVIMDQAKAELAASVKTMSLNIVSPQTSAEQELTSHAELFNQEMTVARVALLAD